VSNFSNLLKHKQSAKKKQACAAGLN